jgi:copper chaperone CopZ
MYKTTIAIDGMMCSMCESHINDAVRRGLNVKKVTSSQRKGETVMISEEPVTEADIHAVIDPTGYQVKSVKSEPYEKKGLFGRK